VTRRQLGADGRHVHGASCSEGSVSGPGCEDLVLNLDALWSEVDWVIGDEAEAETKDEGGENETAVF
jgi:hypothetical protein